MISLLRVAIVPIVINDGIVHTILKGLIDLRPHDIRMTVVFIWLVGLVILEVLQIILASITFVLVNINTA
jgi:ABC-type uncharacterized transport system permease subunit